MGVAVRASGIPVAHAGGSRRASRSRTGSSTRTRPLLFYDCMLRTDGGQKELLAGGAAPAHPDLPDLDLKGGTRFWLDLRPIVSNFKFWADKYDRLMQLGSKG